MSGKRTADMDRCLSLLAGMAGIADSARVLVIEGEPRSKARPRFSGNGHVYTPKKQVENERLLGWNFKRSFREPLAGNLALACIFYRSNQSRVDVDNMLKQVMDAANTICWKDDYQVTAILGIVEMDRANPRIVVAISPHQSSLSRAALPMRTCGHCGSGFQGTTNAPTKRFCSRRCVTASRGQDLMATVPCAGCGKDFKRRTTRQRLCSDACNRTRLKSRPRVVCRCVDCSVKLPGHGQRCRACWRANKALLRANPRAEITIAPL